MSYVFPFNDLSDYQFKNPDKQLFLPEELGRIVNAYAKPSIRYKKTYEDMLKAFDLKRWPELGRKLCVKNHVLWMLMRVFLVAKKNADKVEKIVRTYQDEGDDPNVYYTANEAQEVTVDMHTLLQEVYKTSRDAVLIAVYGKNPPHSWRENYV